MRSSALLMVATACLLVAGGSGTRGAEPKKVGPVRVAVTAFDTTSEDARYASLGTGIQAMLTTDLGVAPEVQLVEREKLQAIQQELALTRSSAFDRATVVKVGKLLGASHLLTGTITIVGEAMRIDARLVDAASGEVVLSDKAEGDAALFFELEKGLAQKLVKALGAPLTPKERARLAKIHTADLDAFRRFSDGIVAFDRHAFDEARKALRDALARDEEFQLAELTLADYERIIGTLGARSELLEAGERQAKAEARSARAAEQKAILTRLFALAEDKDEDERMAAVYALYRWHDDKSQHDVELHLVEDRFLVARTADALIRSYFAAAEVAFPKVPLFGTRDFIFDPPTSAEEVAKEQERWLARFFGTDRRSDAQKKLALLEDIRRGVSGRELARHLRLDVRAEARLAERVYRLALKIDPDAVGAFFDRGRDWRQDMCELLGQRYREAGMFDESTRWFAESGRLADKPLDAERAAREVAENRDIVELLAAHPSAHVREWLMLRRYQVSKERWWRETIEALSPKVLGPRGRRVLTTVRDVRGVDSAYILIGGHALYPMPGTFFRTGRRSDPLVAEGVEYYRQPSRSAGQEWWKAFYDVRHEGALSVRLSLGYAPDDEWWDESLGWDEPDLAAAGYVDERPELVVLFGAGDIDVPATRDETRHERLQRGMRAYGLRIAKDRVELVRVTEPEVKTGFSVARDRLSFEVLDDDAGKIADRAQVQLTVDGKVVRAKVGKLSVDATLSEVPRGFVGYAFLGSGHLAVIAPTVKN